MGLRQNQLGKKIDLLGTPGEEGLHCLQLLCRHTAISMSSAATVLFTMHAWVPAQNYVRLMSHVLRLEYLSCVDQTSQVTADHANV